METTKPKNCNDASEIPQGNPDGLCSSQRPSDYSAVKDGEASKTEKSEPPRSTDKNYIMWENEANSCWLDSSLALLAHNQTMRHVIHMNPECQVSKAIKSYDEAILTLNNSLSEVTADERLLIAKSILKKSQESCMNYLQPLLKCKKGEPDSAFCSLLNLIKEDKLIQGFFTVTFTWVRLCDSCDIQRALTSTKPIITIFRVENFSPENLVSPYQCQSCKKKDQKMKLVYKKLPECLIFHFETGAGNGTDLPLNFSVASREYQLTCVMMLEKSKEANVNHFVSYVRDPSINKWLECNDLNPETVSFIEVLPEFKLQDVYICVFEAFDDLGTVEVEEELSLVYSNSSIPCIDLSDEEDITSSPKKSENNKDLQTENKGADAETVENVKNFLSAFCSQQSSSSNDKSDKTAEIFNAGELAIDNNTNAVNSTQVLAEGIDSSNFELNLPNKSLVPGSQDQAKVIHKVKKKVKVPVEGFDVEKFVEQRLKEFAANQTSSLSLILKSKNLYASPTESNKQITKVSHPKVNAPNSIKPMISESSGKTQSVKKATRRQKIVFREKLDELKQKLRGETKAMHMNSLKQLSALQDTFSGENWNEKDEKNLESKNSNEEADAVDSTDILGKKSTDDKSIKETNCKLFLDDEHLNKNIDSFSPKKNSDKMYEQEVLKKSNVVETGIKSEKLNVDTLMPDIDSTRKTISSRTLVKAHKCDQSVNDSIINQISDVFDNNEHSFSPKEVFVRLKESPRVQSKGFNKALKSRKEIKTELTNNGNLSSLIEISKILNEDLQNTAKNDTKEKQTADVRKQDKPVECNQNLSINSLHEDSISKEMISEVQTQMSLTSACKRSPRHRNPKNAENDSQVGHDAADKKVKRSLQNSNLTEPAKRILKVKILPRPYKSKINVDLYEELENDVNELDAVNDSPPVKKMKTELSKVPKVVAVQTLNTKNSMNVSSCSTLTNQKSNFCWKKNCQCHKVEKEKVVDSVVDHILMRMFQMYPIEKNAIDF